MHIEHAKWNLMCKHEIIKMLVVSFCTKIKYAHKRKWMRVGSIKKYNPTYLKIWNLERKDYAIRIYYPPIVRVYACDP